MIEAKKLFQINSETSDARTKVDETASAVENLQTRLIKLQRKFTKNEHDTKEVKSRVQTAKDISTSTHEKAQKVCYKNKRIHCNFLSFLLDAKSLQ